MLSRSVSCTLKEISEEYNFIIFEMETDIDHIHLLIKLTPIYNIPHIMKIMMGITSHILRRKYKYEISKKL